MSKQKKVTMPEWVTTGNRGYREVGTEPWYLDPVVFWRWRAIHHPHRLDFVPDRGGFVEGGKSAERAEFVIGVLDSEQFAEWVARQRGDFAEWVARQRGDSDNVFTADGRGYHLRACNNQSYGYTYLWAWYTEEGACAQ